jgi:hypothetical protein
MKDQAYEKTRAAAGKAAFQAYNRARGGKVKSLWGGLSREQQGAWKDASVAGAIELGGSLHYKDRPDLIARMPPREVLLDAASWFARCTLEEVAQRCAPFTPELDKRIKDAIETCKLNGAIRIVEGPPRVWRIVGAVIRCYNSEVLEEDATLLEDLTRQILREPGPALRAVDTSRPTPLLALNDERALEAQRGQCAAAFARAWRAFVPGTESDVQKGQGLSIQAALEEAIRNADSPSQEEISQVPSLGKVLGTLQALTHEGHLSHGPICTTTCQAVRGLLEAASRLPSSPQAWKPEVDPVREGIRAVLQTGLEIVNTSLVGKDAKGEARIIRTAQVALESFQAEGADLSSPVQWGHLLNLIEGLMSCLRTGHLFNRPVLSRVSAVAIAGMIPILASETGILMDSDPETVALMLRLAGRHANAATVIGWSREARAAALAWAIGVWVRYTGAAGYRHPPEPEELERLANIEGDGKTS